MPRFVHLAREAMAKRIVVNGIRPRRIPRHPADLLGEDPDRLIWAFPLLQDFAASYQWLRELKWCGARTIVAIVFKIDDDEPVFVRHFGQEPRAMSAAEAYGFILRLDNPLGYELMIPRRIRPPKSSASGNLLSILAGGLIRNGLLCSVPVRAAFRAEGRNPSAAG